MSSGRRAHGKRFDADPVEENSADNAAARDGAVPRHYEQRLSDVGAIARRDGERRLEQRRAAAEGDPPGRDAEEDDRRIAAHQAERQRSAGEEEAAHQSELTEPTVDQKSGDPDASQSRKAKDEQDKIDAAAQARGNHERRDVGVEDVVGEDEGERDDHHRPHAGNREHLTHRRALARR